MRPATAEPPAAVPDCKNSGSLHSFTRLSPKLGVFGRNHVTSSPRVVYVVTIQKTTEIETMTRAITFAATVLLLGTTPLLGQDYSPLEFREIGPGNVSGRIVDLAVVESDPLTFYVATSTGGVWKTTDNAVNFEIQFDDQAVHSIGDITVHQIDTNVVWVGTGERASRQSNSWGDGVYKSTDGGQSWQNMGLHDSHHIGRIALHPTNSNIVYVAAMGHLWGPNEERGLYMSTDGGQNWTRTLGIDENTGVVDVAIDPSDPNIMYAASYQRRRRPFGFHGGGPGSALWKSTDGGRNWSKLDNGLPTGDYGRIGISIYRSDPNIVYISLEQGWRYNASTAYTDRRAGMYRSENKGESWEFMSDWNPRPMYASQPLVDPNDDQRIYMLNSYSVSEDGGRTFRSIRSRTHGDDRLVWVNPKDSRHVMKADDGGLGISYDRGNSFLFVTSIQVSQFYRISVDMKNPYWVYGGLQDNGSWAGPNATYRREGILVDDWFRTGGGDGFLSLVDTTDNRTLYVESQYLGLNRFDLKSRISTSIRPGAERGAIGGRRNFDAWGADVPEPELANAMEPANWDGPFIISPHNNRTIYAGTRRVWKSPDQGATWIDLGDHTTGTNRRYLSIMGQTAHDSTPSLDDGIPYWPTTTAIDESPLTQGVLYVGTDDGQFKISRDDGSSWTDLTGRLPGLPEMAMINGIETSQFDPGAVYVSVNNYRNDDFTNYLYRCVEYGQQCISITGDLPADRVVRTVREDTRNPNVLYLGTEFGLFYSNDWGSHWTPLTGGLPTVPVNDLVIHPRDNDLIIGTHGRGAWILDQINALQEFTPEIASGAAHLFTIQPAEMIRYSGAKAHTGSMIYQGQNPTEGAVIDFFIGEDTDTSDADITIYDRNGTLINTLTVNATPGLNRTGWNLRHTSPVPSRGQTQGRFGGGPSGAWVLPDTYTVRLTVDGTGYEQTVEVREDPRVEIDESVRVAWHATVMEIGGQLAQVSALADSLTAAGRDQDLSDPAQTAYDAIAPLYRELRSRFQRLYGAVNGTPGTPTGDQQAQFEYFKEKRAELEPRVRRILRN
jgi:photosystem II stability/assembly factor-like uncharacterized protein